MIVIEKQGPSSIFFFFCSGNYIVTIHYGLITLQEARRLDPILIMTTSPALIVYRSQLLEQNDRVCGVGSGMGGSKYKNKASQPYACHLIIEL